MRAVIDENLPRSLSVALGEMGWEVYDVRDWGLRGEPDRQIMSFAISRKAVLLSGDFDFANILDFPLKSHYGVIILHFPNEISTKTLVKGSVSSLRKISSKPLKGRLVIVEPGKIRIRK